MAIPPIAVGLCPQICPFFSSVYSRSVFTFCSQFDILEWIICLLEESKWNIQKLLLWKLPSS